MAGPIVNVQHAKKPRELALSGLFAAFLHVYGAEIVRFCVDFPLRVLRAQSTTAIMGVHVQAAANGHRMGPAVGKLPARQHRANSENW